MRLVAGHLSRQHKRFIMQGTLFGNGGVLGLKQGVKKEKTPDDQSQSTSKAKEMSPASAPGAPSIAKPFSIESSKAKSGRPEDWDAGQPVPYAALSDAFSRIEATTKRLEIQSILSSLFAKIIQDTPEDLVKTVYLCVNRVGPDYENLELGIGERMLVKAISENTSYSEKKVNEEKHKTGDLGLVALSAIRSQTSMFKPKPLTVRGVFDAFRAIAETTGGNSQERKRGIINRLIAACVNDQVKFIIRGLETKLRIGLAEQTVVIAIAQAYVQAREGIKSEVNLKQLAQVANDSSDEEDIDTQDRTLFAVNKLKQVMSLVPSFSIVFPALLEHGIDKLDKVCTLTPGVPLKPMLAKPTKSIADVLNKCQDRHFTCEYKYDGERAQVHFSRSANLRKIFSRNSEDMTVKYPDVLHSIDQWAGDAESFVIDAEVVAYDTVNKKILPFQDLSRRKRKDVEADQVAVRVHLFAFDMLYFNGESLLSRSLQERRELLYTHMAVVPNEFAFATYKNTDSMEVMQEFLDQSIHDSCEGLMVKMLDGEGSSYEPSKRSTNWLKVKKDYLNGAGDSFDLTVIGAYYGTGKRKGVYGGFLLACFDPETEQYQAVCKIGTGFSEANLDAQFAVLKDLETPEPKKYFDTGEEKADVWFEPEFVWEVLAADLTLSPRYPAGRGMCDDSSRGISLRFPRFIRTRDDKKPEMSTSAEGLVEAYFRQSGR